MSPRCPSPGSKMPEGGWNSSSGDLAPMTILGVIAILLSFGGLLFASSRPSQARTLFAILLILLHIAASVAYYWYAQTGWADSRGYYFDPGRMASQDFAVGTVFIMKLVAVLKAAFGGSYLDFFFLFQVFGIWGILLLFRTFQEIHDSLKQPPSRLSYALLLLPGLHFWSSGLGKDSLMLLAVCLAVWAAMRLSSRFIAFAAAIGLMVLVRPHIALVATVAMALAVVLDRRSNSLAKSVMLAIAFVGAAYIATSIQGEFKVNVADASSVSEFLNSRYDASKMVSGGSDMQGASFTMRLIAVLFRPLFIDANGLFGLIASFESLALLGIVAFILTKYKVTFWLTRRVFFLTFVAIFTVTITLLLSLVQYNIGLSLRQKIMFYPALFSYFVAIWAASRAGSRASPQAAPTDLGQRASVPQ